MVVERHRTSGALREEHPVAPKRDKAHPVSCPNCWAIVSLTDSECWRCNTYFSAKCFDAQR